MPLPAELDMLPDGSLFPFWKDETCYSRELHVAVNHSAASDDNDGSSEAPLESLAEACLRVQPGEKVIIHAGTYYETLQPERGGTGPDQMIAFEAAAGEDVVISAREPWAPEVQAGGRAKAKNTSMWYAELPQFVGYNPFLASNLAHSDWFPYQQRPLHELHRTQMRCGQIWQNDRKLTQVLNRNKCQREEGTYYVSSDGEKVFLHLYDRIHPDEAELTISVRKHNVCPAVHQCNFIKLSGFQCAYASSPLPMPHYGAVSAKRGHHWIIEHLTIREVNSIGLDLGGQDEVSPANAYPDKKESGHHLVRHNRFIDIGHGGIAANGLLNNSLIEDNEFYRIGHIGLEHVYEAAAIKFHASRGVIVRRNHIHHLRDCCGIWVDYNCGNNRISGNRVYDAITVLAGIYLEISIEPQLVDHNLVWGIRDAEFNDPPKDGTPGGLGIVSDMSDHVWMYHNLIGETESYGLSCQLAQKDRVMGHTTALSRGHELIGNCLMNCGSYIYAARPEHLIADSNVYEHRHNNYFAFPEVDRQARIGLEHWRQWYGHDQHSSQVQWRIDFDPSARTVYLHVDVSNGNKRISDCEDMPKPSFFSSQQWQELCEKKQLILN